jgi:xanthine dehydrogenase iron-sulfur cluster and FAD-binding subunit A
MGQAVRHNIRFLLNGETVELDRVSPTETLLDYLRLSCKLRGSTQMAFAKWPISFCACNIEALSLK